MVYDKPNADVVMMAKLLKEAGHRIIIATGRLEQDKALTITQLNDAGVEFEEFMPDFDWGDFPGKYSTGGGVGSMFRSV